MLFELITSSCDTPNGVTILADQPLGIRLMRNVHRPAFLRQYFGSDIDNSVCKVRAALGFAKGAQSKGSDRMKYTMKLFHKEILKMASYLKSLLNANST